MAVKPTYLQSDELLAAKQALANTEASKPAAYTSNYSDTISTLLNNIVNKKAFSYDFNADPIYQQYKDQYTQQGKQAMADTTAQAASLTGGYGNSYGVTAGNQAYQQNLANLNNVIPDLYNSALSKYQMDSSDQLNKYNAVGTQEDREYGSYRDTVGDYQSNRSYGLSKADSVYNQEYGQYRDGVSDYYNDQSYDYQVSRDQASDAQTAEQFAYQKSQDTVSSDQWNKSFNYQAEQDALALAISKMKASSSGSSSKSGTSENEISTTQKSTLTAKSKEGYSSLISYLDTLVEAGYDPDYLYEYVETELGYNFDSKSSEAAASVPVPTTYQEAMAAGLNAGIMTESEFKKRRGSNSSLLTKYDSYADYLQAKYDETFG